MRTIERTRQFKQDYKREAKGLHRATLENDFIARGLARTVSLVCNVPG